MTEYLITTTQVVSPDRELCSLEAAITDAGVQITAKSPIIEALMKKYSAGSTLLLGEHYSDCFKGLKFYRLPTHVAKLIDCGSIYTDLFVPGNSVDEYGNRRKSEPNLLWLYTEGLGEGVTITFPQPAHIPADIIEYLNRSMEKVRVFHLKFIRRLQAKSVLLERD